MLQPDAVQAKRILIAQLALTLVLPIIALPFGIAVAVSVLIGAAVCLVANSIFALGVFRYYRAQDLKPLLAQCYGAELVKLFLALGLIIVALVTSDDLNPPALLAAYFAVQVLPAVFTPGPLVGQDVRKKER